MRISDFIVLGRTVPEESHKYGLRVCLVGHSELAGGLVRIYPLLVDAPLRSRHGAVLDVTRNPHDSRPESFRLREAVDGIVHITETPLMSAGEVTALAERLHTPSIAALNRRKLSLGFVAVRGTPLLEWRTRETCTDPRQLAFFESFMQDLTFANFLTGKDYARVPYLRFQDAEGAHALQIREWGCFEYLRKCDGTVTDLHERLRLHTMDREWFVLVGNMTNHRNVWLVIQVFSRPKFTGTLPFGA
jgi:hypothetical protein